MSSAVERPGQRWRSSRVVWWAVGALVLEAFLALPGCLNPRPEEFPSASNDTAVPDAIGAERESCGDNPLLAGCQPSAQDNINAESVPSSAPDENADNGPADNAAPSFSVRAAEPEGDAGAPPSDAGASSDSGDAPEP